MPPSCCKTSLVPAASSRKVILRPLCKKVLASSRKRMVSAENSCLPKSCGSGRKKVVVPEPRAGPFLVSLLVATPRA